MRYVVTGAAGFIGSNLLGALLERGHEATGWDAFTGYYDPALKEENARGLPVERLDLVEDALDLAGVDVLPPPARVAPEPSTGGDGVAHDDVDPPS